MRWKLFLICFFITASFLRADEPLENLRWVADAFNEGVQEEYELLGKKQIFANLALILNRPLDGKEYVNEAQALDFNEPQANFAYASILYYYIVYSHSLMGRCTCCPTKILVRVHRDEGGAEMMLLLEKLLTTCFSKLKGVKQKNESFEAGGISSYYFPGHNTYMDFCYGDIKERLVQKVQENDIIISFSLCSDLNPSLPTGSLLMPTEWIPFSLKSMQLFENNVYFVNNHLLKAIPEIIQRQKIEELILINANFLSSNPNKSQKAKLLSFEDFRKATLLKVDEKFDFSKLQGSFSRA